jgi:phospholipid/cholesterol/gamma-HCH transport system permease protein
VIAKPSKFRGTAFVHQIQATGLTAVPIISLVCVLIGGVIMQQGARQLRNFGAETLSIDMLGILALREVGVVLAAVMVAGRSASAFTAQIGTMKMREEIDAMRTLGIDPIETLVLPRILALILVLPLLVFVADIMCLAGGAIMAKVYMALDIPVYLQRLNAAVTAKHFYVGLIKAPFVALVIGLVGCLEGMRVEGSAESVGRQVTTAVVKAIFLVLVLDGIFAIFLSASGF